MNLTFRYSLIIVLFIGFLHGTSLSQTNPPQTSAGADMATQAGKAVPSSQPFLSVDQIYELQRTKAIYGIETEILAWAKSRFWTIAIVAIIVGFFGVRALVRDLISTQLQDAAKASARAEAAADIARDSATDAGKQLRAFGNTITALEDQSKELEHSVAETKAHFEDERKALQANASHAVASAELEVEGLKEQLSQLTTLVEKLAETSDQHHDLLRAFEKSRQAATQKQQSHRKHFEQNSEYRVMIATYEDRLLPAATQISDMLKDTGFKVSEGKWVGKPQDATRVQINYNEKAKEKAEEIRAMLTPILERAGLSVNEGMFLRKDNKSTDDISILFL